MKHFKSLINNCVIKIIFLSFLLYPFFSLCQSIDSSFNRVEWNEDVLQPDNFTIINNDAKSDSLMFGAYTYARINYHYDRHLDTIFLSINNFFDCNRSWMRQRFISNKYVLKHEQGHFDLSEIYARKFADEFVKFSFTENYRDEIKQLFSNILFGMRQMQVVYDDETEHSKRVKKQRLWNQKISDTLNMLQPVAHKNFFAIIKNKNYISR